jgi:hypothetical protein
MSLETGANAAAGVAKGSRSGLCDARRGRHQLRVWRHGGGDSGKPIV